MLSSLFISCLAKLKYRKWLKKLRRDNIVLSPPFYVSEKSNLMSDANVYIGPGAWMNLFGNLYIGNGTIIGPRLKVHTANHNYESDMLPYNGDVIVKDVHIGENVWIGADVTLLPGINIGEGAVIGACSCVTKSVPPFSVVGGNPAKILKYRDVERYNKNKEAGCFYFRIKKDVKIRIIKSE